MRIPFTPPPAKLIRCPSVVCPAHGPRKIRSDTPMIRTGLTAIVLAVAFALFTTPAARGEYPKPSPYPKSWQLDFTHGKPKRIVVTPEGEKVPKAFWYMTYTVTNNTGKEQLFLPAFELATEDGKIIRNDINIPKGVFETIKKVEGSRFLQPAAAIGGELRIGA